MVARLFRFGAWTTAVWILMVVSVTAAGGRLLNPTLEVDRSATHAIPVEIEAGQTSLVEEDGIARIYDSKGSQVKSLVLSTRVPMVRSGANHIGFDAEFQGDSPPKAVVTFKTLGSPTRVGK